VTIPDPSLQRRINDLEREVRTLELRLDQMRQNAPRQVLPICGRLWQFELNEDMGTTNPNEAGADLVSLQGTDTLLDVTISDVLGIWGSLVDTDTGLCVEQYDVDGTLLYVPVTCP